MVATVFEGSRCNSTVMLDNSRPVVYIRVPGGSGESRAVGDQLITTSGLSAQPRAYSTSGRREFSASCPTVFKTRPGQRVAITLYSFRSGHGPVPEVAWPGSDGSDAVVAACDVGPVIVMEADGRRRIHGLCDPRQHREQLLLTTNTSQIAIYFADIDQNRPTKPPQRPSDSASPPVTNFIMKLEGTWQG